MFPVHKGGRTEAAIYKILQVILKAYVTLVHLNIITIKNIPYVFTFFMLVNCRDAPIYEFWQIPITDMLDDKSK